MRYSVSSFSLIMYIMLFGCHSGDQTVNDGGLVLLDANQKGARMDLHITDVADVYLIPLRFGPDNVLLNITSARRSLFVFHNEIFLGNWLRDHPLLVVYNFQGEPIRLIGSRGRGPGEYLQLSGFIVDTLANEIITYDRDANKFLVYSTTGIFKRERFVENNGLYTQYTDIENINDRYMLAYKDNSREVSDKTWEVMGVPIVQANTIYNRGRTFTLYDKQTLSEVDFLNFDFARPSQWNAKILFHNLTTTENGVYITSQRTDTIYFMDRNLELSPQFVDVTNYSAKFNEAHLFPVAETNKYIFFSVEIAFDPEQPNRNKIKHFVYDKEVKQFFRLNTGLSEDPMDCNYKDALIRNKVAFDQFLPTLNHDFVSSMLTPEYLWKRYNELPEIYRNITKNLKMDDNPILMLMKLKSLSDETPN